jgi:UDP-glucose-4-epimerase GalE
MTTILVTGGAGYIGSHACKALAQAGFTPVTYDNLGRGHPWAVKWGPLEIGDLSDTRRLQEVFRRYQPSAVMHFAAYAYVGESVTDPALYYGNNVVGSWQLLEAMRTHDVRNIVFSSTCAVYGEGHAAPISETTAIAPVSPYGVSKSLVERMLGDYSKAYGFRTVSLRYFNAAGADPAGELGEAHEPESHIIPLVLAEANGSSGYLQIFGEDYPTPDGTCIRDYIHVTDLAEAHVLALKRMLSSGMTGVFNLGTGNGYSVRQILDAAMRVTGRDIQYRIGPRRAGDPPFAVADPAQAMSELSWTPHHSDLDNMIRTAWQWLQASAASSRNVDALDVPERESAG